MEFDLALILEQLSFHTGGDWMLNAGVKNGKKWCGTHIFKEPKTNKKYWLHRASQGILIIQVCSCGGAKYELSPNQKKICPDCKKELIIDEIGLFVG